MSDVTREGAVASAVHQALSMVIKAAELLQHGPYMLKREGNMVLVGWLPTANKQPALMLRFDALPNDELGCGDLIANELPEPIKADLKQKMRQLFDYGTLKALEYRGFKE